MPKTITFVTNQYSCDRIIRAARTVADESGTDLVVVGILDSEYTLDPEVVDYLFKLSKKNRAVMRLLFTEDKTHVMREMIGERDCESVVTGMPSSNQSVLYQLWKAFPNKSFHTVAETGEALEVASALCFRSA